MKIPNRARALPPEINTKHKTGAKKTLLFLIFRTTEMKNSLTKFKNHNSKKQKQTPNLQ
jgi:hypothetical protein